MHLIVNEGVPKSFSGLINQSPYTWITDYQTLVGA